jgi:Glycosyl hydrolase family 76
VVRKAVGLVILILALAAAPARAGEPPALPAQAQVSADRAQLSALATSGVRLVKNLWWNSGAGWYNERLNGAGSHPLSSIWSTVHLFNALNAVAAADRTRFHLRMLENFANRADTLYWNPLAGHVPHTRKHVGGYSPYPNWRGTGVHTFYDDNGWLGLAFYNAWQITGKNRYLNAAQRAFAFTAITGWAKKLGGGVWWDTRHTSRSSEGIASNALLGALLYKTTKRPDYLRQARIYIAWSNGHIWDPKAQLYMRDPNSPILMAYVQSPFMAAQQTLCEATGDQSWCAGAKALAEATLRHFPAAVSHGPQYDSMYLQWMLYQYQQDHDPRWYALAYYNAKRALSNSGDGTGLFVRDWDGDALPNGDTLQAETSTLSLFAWVAAATPPQ